MRNAILLLAGLAVALPAPALAQTARADSRWADDGGRWDDRSAWDDRTVYADMDAAQRRWDEAQARFEREREAYEGERFAYEQARDRFERDRERLAAYSGPTWRGPNGETFCRRPDGTTGTIVGAVAGALLGRAIDGGRRRGVGTILGGGAGALLGRGIERGQDTCR
jgi:hypothetical protein